jgi:hypothetical protein
MQFEDITFVGDSLMHGGSTDVTTLERVPADLRMVLEQTNGLVAYRGGFHLRGAVLQPAWHALAAAWEGPAALHARYPAVRESDVPFAQDALGDQFVLRDGQVWRLTGETGDLEPQESSLTQFLTEVATDPHVTLDLSPLRQFEAQGGTLAPGQLLSVYPPYVFATEGSGQRSFKAIPAADRLAFLAHLAAQIADLPDGTPVEFIIRPDDG